MLVTTNKKILITGTTGAVGSEVLKQLDTANKLGGVTVLVRDSKNTRKVLKPFRDKINVRYGDITNLAIVKEAVKNQDIVIHLAAIIPTVEDDNDELVKRVNVGGTENIVRSMEAGCPNALLLFSSSIAIYGDRIKDPDIRISDPPKGLDHDNYSRTKVDAETLIKSSKLNWSIFRLTAIMGIGNHKISGIMFNVPLETPFEIATVRDTARAFVNSIDHAEALTGRIFNLGGGEACRITYFDFLSRAFKAFGLGKINFPNYAFAKQNFHCGHYIDGDELEAIIHFRSDDIESYFKRFDASVPRIQRFFTLPFGGIVKWFLLKLSVPFNAYKKGDQEKINFFFGNIEQ
jgi:nucleoside-diphosphate-sugar epimerase